ncbi:hypothetical protein EAF00_011027 [Botryotinia globosa]|nr:hypothetical protein EAF00_011027 [Botryotinia globosa]
MAKETDDRRELRNQTLQVFLAGHEATAIGVGNAIFWLSLRLIPIAPTITRGAVCDTILPRGGGPSGTSPILVKAGTCEIGTRVERSGV